MKKVKINSEIIEYLDMGESQSTLLFIHGAFINKEYWIEQLKHFSKEHRVVALDLPGHGSSTFNQKDWTQQRFGSDVHTFIKTLGLKNVIIIGHSFGSDIMFETLAHDATDIIGIVEIDHMKNIGVRVPKQVADQIIAGLHVDFDTTCKNFASEVLLSDETSTEIKNKLFGDYKTFSPTIGIPLLEAGFRYTDRQIELLNNLQLKLYSIHVNYSDTNKEGFKKHLGDDHELIVINGTCHYPMIENPILFNDTLESIIEKITVN